MKAADYMLGFAILFGLVLHVMALGFDADLSSIERQQFPAAGVFQSVGAPGNPNALKVTRP